MKKLSTYSSSHTLRFPKVPQKLQKCQSIIISPSDTSEKIQAHEPARPPSPRAEPPGTVPASQPRRGRGRIWTRQRPQCQLWAPAALAMTAISPDSRGPQGCGGCRAHGRAPRDPGSRGTRRSVLVAGWLEEDDNTPPCSLFLGDPGDVAWQPTLASRQSYGQELSHLDNLEMSVLHLTCSHKHSY